MRRFALIATACVVLSLASCGGDEDSGASDAMELTRWLPTDSPSYSAVDVAALKADLDLPPDSDPLGGRISSWTAGSWVGLFFGYPSPAVVRALDLSAVTQVADRGATKDVQPVTAMRTSAPPGEIRDALLDLGFVEREGILEGPRGKRANVV